MIALSPKQLTTIIDATPTNQSVMIVGDHGIGKSTIVAQLAQERGIKLIEMFLGQYNDAGDMVGPTVRIGDRKFGFLDPEWWPEANERCWILLDELNRARTELHSTIFDLVLKGRILGRDLPFFGEENGSRIIAAVNAGDDYFVQEMDPALISRFNMYRLTITAKDWIEWARVNKVNRHVIAFIEKNPTLLWVKADGLEKGSDPRAWHRASDFLNKNHTWNPADQDYGLLLGYALEGIIGGTAAMLLSHMRRGGLSANDMLRIPTNDKEAWNSSWEEIDFNLSMTSEPDLNVINTQFISATHSKLTNEAVERYGVNFYRYISWLLENSKRDIAADVLGVVKEDTRAMQVYLINIDIMMAMTEILDSFGK